MNLATLNRNLTEAMACFIARQRAAPSDVLGFLAADVRFKDSYKLKTEICKNPKTPLRVSVSLLKQLRIFDIVEITVLTSLPSVIRQKAELALEERLKTMPIGVMSSLARKVSAGLAIKMLMKAEKTIIYACLSNRYLTEDHILGIINSKGAKQAVIEAISQHPSWALRYRIRFALLRNFHTPTSTSAEFIPGMKTKDIQYLYTDCKTPSSTKPFLYRELMSRSAPLEPEEDEQYEIRDGDE